MNFKVGDRVIIRDWDDMENEYGLSDIGSIACTFYFTEEMKPLCGQSFKISSVRQVIEGPEFSLDPISDAINAHFVNRFSYSASMLRKETEHV